MKIKRKVFEDFSENNAVYSSLEEYNERGDIVYKRKKFGLSESQTWFFYNENGLICKTKEDDKEYSFHYNDKNQLECTKYNNDIVNTYSYPAPNVVQCTTKNYTTTKVYTDETHKHVLEEYDTNGYRGWTKYDSDYNVIETGDNNNNVREYFYENGKLIKELVKRGDWYSLLENKYDENGNLITVIIEGKIVTERKYDDRGNKILEINTKDKRSTRYEYNEHNDMTRFDTEEGRYGIYHYEYWD